MIIYKNIKEDETMAFSMELPDVETVTEEVQKDLTPTAETQQQLVQAADSNTAELFTFDMDSLSDRREIVSSIESFGTDIVQKSTQKNELLNVRLADLSKMGGENGEVVNGLTQLNMQMKDLDPSKVDFAKKGVLGKVFNPVRNYFAKFERADEVIARTVESLGRGREVLRRDNTTLEVEQLALRDLTKKLAKQIELGMQMDEAISAAIEKAKTENVDEERIKFIEEEVR